MLQDEPQCNSGCGKKALLQWPARIRRRVGAELGRQVQFIDRSRSSCFHCVKQSKENRMSIRRSVAVVLLVGFAMCAAGWGGFGDDKPRDAGVRAKNARARLEAAKNAYEGGWK